MPAFFVYIQHLHAPFQNFMELDIFGHFPTYL
jgi:hypothetical protein